VDIISTFADILVIPIVTLQASHYLYPAAKTTTASQPILPRMLALIY
jgi:hypothetical protein